VNFLISRNGLFYTRSGQMALCKQVNDVNFRFAQFSWFCHHLQSLDKNFGAPFPTFLVSTVTNIYTWARWKLIFAIIYCCGHWVTLFIIVRYSHFKTQLLTNNSHNPLIQSNKLLIHRKLAFTLHVVTKWSGRALSCSNTEIQLPLLYSLHEHIK